MAGEGINPETRISLTAEEMVARLNRLEVAAANDEGALDARLRSRCPGSRTVLARDINLVAANSCLVCKTLSLPQVRERILALLTAAKPLRRSGEAVGISERIYHEGMER